MDDSGSGNTYGGTTAGLGNVISGNYDGGLNTSGNVTIEGNYIGTDVTGKVAIGNGQSGDGIFSAESASATSISMTISNNVISGNYDGITLYQTVGSQSSYTISDNLIGTDASGTVALGNKGFGLDLTSVENATVLNNVISGNHIGVRTQTNTPSGELQHDVFQGNLIGTDKTGQVAMGNTDHGIDIESGTGITIGGTGPGQGNVIANSGEYGIYLPSGQQVQFTRNSIFGNAKGGIYRGDGVDGFASPPTLTFAPGTGSNGTLSGTVTESEEHRLRHRDLLQPDGPVRRGRDVRSGGDRNDRRNGPRHVLPERADRFLYGHSHRPVRKHLGVLGGRGDGDVGGERDGSLFIGESVDVRSAGHVHGGRLRPGLSGDAVGYGDIHHRSARLRRPFRSRSSAVWIRRSTLAQHSRQVSTRSRRLTAAIAM